MHPLMKYVRESQSRKGPAGSSENCGLGARPISLVLGNKVDFHGKSMQSDRKQAQWFRARVLGQTP